MPKFMMIYKGEAADMSDMTEEQQADVMGKWMEWMGRVGDGMADIGTPFGPGTSIVDDGSEASADAMTGYTILEADDLAGAKALVDGHPYLSEGKGNYAIDVFELMPVPFEA